MNSSRSFFSTTSIVSEGVAQLLNTLRPKHRDTEKGRQTHGAIYPSSWPLHRVSHTMFCCHTPHPPLRLFSFLCAWPTPATFHCLDSHWMENSWVGDCPEHIMPNPSMNSHLPLPSPPLSSELPCSSFKVGPRSWNKRKTACMRTCFSPTYGTLFLSLFLWICFPTLLPWWCSGVMAGSTFDRVKNAEMYCSWAAVAKNASGNESKLFLCPDSRPGTKQVHLLWSMMWHCKKKKRFWVWQEKHLKMVEC